MEMTYRRMGKSGLQLSSLSFGSWVTFGSQVDDFVAERIMSAAYDAGVNFFDNAESYSSGESEAVMGRVIQKTGWSRDTIVISSKVFWGGKMPRKPNQIGLSKKHVFEACHNSMNRLQVDYLDLFYCHRPDANTPIEETVWAMHQLVMQGKILYWGTSEWSAQEIMQAHTIAAEHHITPPSMEQPQYNMLVRERFEKEYDRLYSQYGMGTTIWSPLASGFLSGKYINGIPAGSRFSIESLNWLPARYLSNEVFVETVKNLKGLADELGCTCAQLALAWCLKNPHVSSVILGATRVEQLTENLGAITVVPKLTTEILAKIEAILNNKPKLPEVFS